MWLSCEPSEGEESGILVNRRECRLRLTLPKMLYLLHLGEHPKSVENAKKIKN